MTPKLYGVVTREIYSLDGTLLFSKTEHNTVVNNGIEKLRNAMVGIGSCKATTISIGTGAMIYTEILDSASHQPILVGDTPVMGWVFRDDIPETDTELWEFYASSIPNTTHVIREAASAYTVVSDFVVGIDARVCEAVLAFDDGSILSKQMFSPTSVDAAARLAASTGLDVNGQPPDGNILLRLTWRVAADADVDLQGISDPDFEETQ
jgi:hypothetical protein